MSPLRRRLEIELILFAQSRLRESTLFARLLSLHLAALKKQAELEKDVHAHVRNALALIEGAGPAGVPGPALGVAVTKPTADSVSAYLEACSVAFRASVIRGVAAPSAPAGTTAVLVELARTVILYDFASKEESRSEFVQLFLPLKLSYDRVAQKIEELRQKEARLWVQAITSPLTASTPGLKNDYEHCRGPASLSLREPVKEAIAGELLSLAQRAEEALCSLKATGLRQLQPNLAKEQKKTLRAQWLKYRAALKLILRCRAWWEGYVPANGASPPINEASLEGQLAACLLPEPQLPWVTTALVSPGAGDGAPPGWPGLPRSLVAGYHANSNELARINEDLVAYMPHDLLRAVRFFAVYEMELRALLSSIEGRIHALEMQLRQIASPGQPAPAAGPGPAPVPAAENGDSESPTGIRLVIELREECGRKFLLQQRLGVVLRRRAQGLRALEGWGGPGKPHPAFAAHSAAAVAAAAVEAASAADTEAAGDAAGSESGEGAALLARALLQEAARGAADLASAFTLDLIGSAPSLRDDPSLSGMKALEFARDRRDRACAAAVGGHWGVDGEGAGVDGSRSADLDQLSDPEDSEAGAELEERVDNGAHMHAQRRQLWQEEEGNLQSDLEEDPEAFMGVGLDYLDVEAAEGDDADGDDLALDLHLVAVSGAAAARLRQLQADI